MSAPDTIVVARGPGETRAALLAGDAVLEVDFARDGEIAAGMVIAARVTGFLGGAAFVEIGDALPGVLRAKPKPNEGAVIAARVIVPHRSGKGAEVKLADGVVLPSGAKAGAVLTPPPDRAKAWWDAYGPSIRRIVCASAAEQRRVRALLGEDAPIQLHGAGDPFADLGIDDAVALGLSPDVPLPCGGALRIETTAGATVIDVDAGPAAPDIANAEAMAAVAHALRLRYIDDPAGIAIAGVTPLGMIELTRRRVGLSLWETLAQGERRVATLSCTALRRAVRLAFQAKTARVAIAAEADVIALLQGRLRPALSEAQETAKVEIALRPRAAGIDVAAD
jgi:Ribonuclease G/E